MEIYQPIINKLLNERSIDNSKLTAAEVSHWSNNSKNEFLRLGIGEFDKLDIEHETTKDFKSVTSGNWTEHKTWYVKRNSEWIPTRLFEYPRSGDSYQITPGDIVVNGSLFNTGCIENTFTLSGSTSGGGSGESSSYTGLNGILVSGSNITLQNSANNGNITDNIYIGDTSVSGKTFNIGTQDSSSFKTIGLYAQSEPDSYDSVVEIKAISNLGNDIIDSYISLDASNVAIGGIFPTGIDYEQYSSEFNTSTNATSVINIYTYPDGLGSSESNMVLTKESYNLYYQYFTGNDVENYFSSLYGSNNYFQIHQAYAPDSNSVFYSDMTFYNDKIEFSLVGTGHTGVVFDRDMSALYTNRSIVDKAYVDGQVSDNRLKTNVTQLSNSLNNILQLSGVSFTWNELVPNKVNTEDIGLIAQNVEQFYPEAVYDTYEYKDQTYKRVDYKKLVPVLIEAIKELTRRVEELESK